MFLQVSNAACLHESLTGMCSHSFSLNRINFSIDVRFHALTMSCGVVPLPPPEFPVNASLLWQESKHIEPFSERGRLIDEADNSAAWRRAEG